MAYKTIEFEQTGSVGVIRLNRPHRMNAVVEEMYEELQDVLKAALDDPDLRALVLTGTVWKSERGEKQAFCAGADLKRHSSGERTHEEQRRYIELAHETTRGIHESEKPVIAAVNGPARGAGAELAICCDFLLMADTATLAFPETSLGTCVGGGVSLHLTQILGLMRAKHLLLTGQVLAGPEAARLGLALASLPLERLLPESLALAGMLAEKAPLSMRLVKRLLHEARSRDLRTVLGDETEAILECMTTDDWREGLAAFAEKRKPHYHGR